MLAMGSRVHLHRWIAPVGAGLALAASAGVFAQVWADGPQALAVGGWRAPIGIVLAADTLGALMVLAGSLVGLAGTIAASATVDEARARHFFFPVLMVLLAGVNGSFLTGDLFNLYVWFEVMLMASFVLISLGDDKKQLPAALRYMSLNLIGSVLFLSGCGLVYGLAGSLNMADLAGRLALQDPVLVGAVSMLFLAAFCIKAAAFPLFAWLPSSYPVPPAAVSAVMAGLLTKVGVYALFRMFTLVFPDPTGLTQTIILTIAIATMVLGVVGAYGQSEYRRVLSFHIISQIGYMILGLSLGTAFGIAAGLFMVIHNMAAKTALFWLAGAAEESFRTPVLKKMGGLRDSAPLTTWLFLAAALGLAGLPPLSGFWAKLAVVRGALEGGQGWAAAAALAVGMVTLLSMIKIGMEAYWKPRPEGAPEPKDEKGQGGFLVPAAILAGAVVLMGLFAGPVFDVCLRAGEELRDPFAYKAAVLGGPEP